MNGANGDSGTVDVDGGGDADVADGDLRFGSSLSSESIRNDRDMVIICGFPTFTT